MAHILAVGIATLDIVNEVERFPAEDDEVRALARYVRRGGNATNTLVVLSQLGHRCEWAGVLAQDSAAEVIEADLAQYRIETCHCRRTVSGTTPTSYIVQSKATGSRTIVHYRDLPEYDVTSFSAIPLNAFDWVHFEGRNIEETRVMMRLVRERHPRCPVSLEIEKARPDIESLLPFAGLIFTTAGVARHRGVTPEALLRDLRERAPGADLVCTLGGLGAAALAAEGATLTVPAFPPLQLVDTVGAGDTFNAAMIHSRLKGRDLRESLHYAGFLAGKKCGQQGLDGLRDTGIVDA